MEFLGSLPLSGQLVLVVEASGKPCGQGRRLSSGRREELRPEVAIFKRLLERRGSCGVWEFLYPFLRPWVEEDVGKGGIAMKRNLF